MILPTSFLNREHGSLLFEPERMLQEVDLTDMEWHLLSTAYIHLVSEIVRHDMPIEDARKHMSFVCRLLYPGWKELLGIK